MVYVLAFLSSALACLLIVRSARLHVHFTAGPERYQPQRSHTDQTPRIGGLAIFAGLLVAGLYLPIAKADIGIYWLLMWSLVPAFAAGFVEDITGRVGPGTRLLFTMITAGFAYSLTGVRFIRSDMAWLDTAIAFAPFGYAALLFAVAGVAHAMNLIDGYNGLASGFAGITYTALGYVACDQGDLLVATFCYVAGAANAGFFIFNYPRGRIFLGDGGAYLHGCIIALASALLVLRDKQVSPWFPMALVAYPVWETVFSMGRRILKFGSPRISEPDARHLHSLVYRRISRLWVRGRRNGDRALRNSVTSIPFIMVSGLLAVPAVMAYNHTRALQALIVGVIALYCALYWELTSRHRRSVRTVSLTRVAARNPAAAPVDARAPAE